MGALLDNPLFVKHVRSRLRKQHVVAMVTGLLLVCACIFWAGVEVGGFADGTIFAVFMLMAGILLLLGGTSQVATAVGKASTSGMLDFHRASPLPAWQVTLGFLFGAPIREYLGAGIVLVFALVSAMLGAPGFLGAFSVLGVFFLSAWFFHSIAVVSGLLARKTRAAGGSLGALVVLCHIAAGLVNVGIALPGLLTCAPAMQEALGRERDRAFGTEPLHPTFFGIDVPLTVQSWIYLVPLIGLVLVAAVRRMRSASALVYSKGAAVLFLAVLAALSMGGLVGHPEMGADRALPVVLCVVAVCGWILTMAVTPDSRLYTTGLRRAARDGGRRSAAWKDTATNRAAVFAMALLAGTAGIVTSLLVPGGSSDAWMAVATAVASIVSFGAALQWFALALRRRAMPYFLLFVFVAWVLPLFIAAVLGMSAGGELARTMVSLCPIPGILAPDGLALAFHAGTAVVLSALLLGRERIEERAVHGDAVQNVYGAMS